MIKIGILGAGFMGSTHARGYAKLPDVKIGAIFSRSAEKAAVLAEEVGASPTTDMESLVKDPQIDVIDVSIPTPWHKEYTLKAFAAGKHVLCEKPMALTVEDAETMAEAAERAGVILMIGHVLRFWPEYVALHDFVQSGKLGKALAATASRLSTRPTWAEWFTHPEQTGGAVLDLMVHDADMLNWLFGQPKAVYARGQRGQPGGWDHVLMLADYDFGKGFVESSVLMPAEYPFTMTLAVLCEKGSVEFNFRAAGTGVETGVPEGTKLTVYEAGKASYPIPAEEGDAYEREVAYFIECVRAGKKPEVVTPEDGVWAVRVCLAARESMETGKVVNF